MANAKTPAPAPVPTPEPWIQTYSGAKFYPLRPRAQDVRPADIAHALSQQCRFTGHTESFYSVAQHCVLVASLVPAALRLAALLHDASEAYLMDLASPLKHAPQFAVFVAAEAAIEQAIATRFALQTTAEEHAIIKQADRVALATEARDLLGPLHADWTMPATALDYRIRPLDSRNAEAQFLTCFFRYGGG